MALRFGSSNERPKPIRYGEQLQGYLDCLVCFAKKSLAIKSSRGRDDMSACVTSFGPSGYDLYGKAFIESFIKWVELPLVVYVEGEDNIPDFCHPLVQYKDLFAVRGMLDVLNLTNFHAARGRIWGEQEIDYRFNVHRFCRKSFAQIDMAHQMVSKGVRNFFWLDADIVFNNTFKLPPLGDDFMVYLGRRGGHSCSSLVGWNLSFPNWEQFFDKYWALYVTGTIFALPEWHDAFVIEWLRKEFEVPSRDLAANIETSPLCNVFDLVFPSARHKKGGLK